MQENSENKEKSQKVYAIRLALDLVRRQHFHNDKSLDTSQQAIKRNIHVKTKIRSYKQHSLSQQRFGFQY